MYHLFTLESSTNNKNCRLKKRDLFKKYYIFNEKKIIYIIYLMKRKLIEKSNLILYDFMRLLHKSR